MFNCKNSILEESLALMLLALHWDDKDTAVAVFNLGSCHPFFLVASQAGFFSVAESRIKCLPLHR